MGTLRQARAKAIHPFLKSNDRSQTFYFPHELFAFINRADYSTQRRAVSALAGESRKTQSVRRVADRSPGSPMKAFCLTLLFVGVASMLLGVAPNTGVFDQDTDPIPPATALIGRPILASTAARGMTQQRRPIDETVARVPHQGSLRRLSGTSAKFIFRNDRSSLQSLHAPLLASFL